jgi:preprotein translocase subunit YajC
VNATLIFILVMLVFLYVLLVRPQRQQAKRHQEMLQTLSLGDEVITAGGIYGEVTALDDERVQLEIDADVRIAVARRAIASKVPPEEAAETAEESEKDSEDGAPEDAAREDEPVSAKEPEPVGEERSGR